MMQAKVEIICDALIAEKKWRSFKDTEVTIAKGGFPVAAYLSLSDRRIHLIFSDQFDFILGSMIRRHELRVDTQTAFEAILYHLLVHEFNHHYYCPGNAFLFQQILDGIRNVVEKRETRESRIRKVCFEIHNMFADTVINAIESHDEQSNRYRVGQDLTHLLALYYNSRGKVLQGRSDKAMTLFLESNKLLTRTSDEIYEECKRYLPVLFWNEDKALQNLIEVFLEEPQLVERALARDLLDSDSGSIVRLMCDYKQWHAKAEDYARIIYPYLKQQHDWLKNSFTGKNAESGAGSSLEASDYGDSKQGNDETGADASHSSTSQEPGPGRPKGTQAEERPAYPGERATEGQHGSSADWPAQGQQEDPVGNEASSEDGRYSAYDEAGPKPATEKGKRQRSSGSEQDAEDDTSGAQESAENGPGKSSSEDGSRSISQPSGRRMGIGSGRYDPRELNYERLNSFYEERAGDIKLEDWEHTGPNLEVMTGTEDADLSSLAKLRLPSSLVLKRPDGSMYLSLKGRRFPLTIDAPVKSNMGGLPDLCFIFDSSGSMRFNPYSEQGEYHIALLTFYSILHGLAAKGIAPLLRYNAVNFSDATVTSGWRPYYEVEQVKRALLQYQGGGTTIDVEKLSAIRHERKDNYLLFLLSDLQISNISALESELVETHESRAAYVLVFKLGGKNLLSSRLESAGVSVLYPSVSEDFMYGSIRIAGEFYSGSL